MDANHTEIAVSYSRKVNHDLYGGQPYESSDHFCSLKVNIDDETDPTECHKELSKLCKRLVDERVEAEIMDMTGGLTKKEFNGWIECVLAENRWGSVEDFNRMSVYQKNIAQTLKKAYKRIKAKKNAGTNNGIEQEAEDFPANG